MRIFLSLMMVLSGLLMTREFMAHSHEQFRLTLRGTRVVSEQSIATVREPPALVAAVAAPRIAEVSAESIAMVRESPAMVGRTGVTRVSEVSEQNVDTAIPINLVVSDAMPQGVAFQKSKDALDLITDARVGTVPEPPAVARMAEVSEQVIPAVHGRPALVTPMTECEQIWDQMTHMTREKNGRWCAAELMKLAGGSLRHFA